MTAADLGGAGATRRLATGPGAGRTITDLAGLNGNGLLARVVVFDVKLNSLDNVTNDLRVGRVDHSGNGDLTTTAGFDAARQSVDTDRLWTSTLLDLRGDGRRRRRPWPRRDPKRLLRLRRHMVRRPHHRHDDLDIDGDTRIPDAERRVAVIPLTSPPPVDYRCLSYSAGINVRVTATAAVGAPMPIACCSHRR